MLNTVVENGINQLEQKSIITDKIVKKCLQLHERFDLGKWPKPSFHNHKHALATIAASKILVEKAFQAGGAQDPFNLVKDLEKYNKSHHIQITQEELARCIKIAFAAHDLGDIGEIKDDRFEFKDGYLPGAGSEVRSTQIIDWLLEGQLEISEKNLIKYLIKETNYTPKKLPYDGIPFARFIRFIDFVGNGFFNQDENRFLGLILELYNRKSDEEKEVWTLDLPVWFNMVDSEFNKYVSLEERKKILEIWGKGEWQEKKEYPLGKNLPTGQTNVRNWLNEVYGKK